MTRSTGNLHSSDNGSAAVDLAPKFWDGNETKTSVLFSCQDDVFKASVWTIWEGHGHPTQLLHLELFAGCLRKRHAHGRISRDQQEQVVHLKASRILTVQVGQLEFKAVLGVTSNCMRNLYWLARWFAGSFHPESYIKCVQIKENGCTTIANDLVHSHKMGRTRKGTTKVLDIKRSARSFLTRQGQSQVILTASVCICLHWNHWFGSWFLGLVRTKWAIALQKLMTWFAEWASWKERPSFGHQKQSLACAQAWYGNSLPEKCWKTWRSGCAQLLPVSYGQKWDSESHGDILHRLLVSVPSPLWSPTPPFDSDVSLLKLPVLFALDGMTQRTAGVLVHDL